MLLELQRPQTFLSPTQVFTSPSSPLLPNIPNIINEVKFVADLYPDRLTDNAEAQKFVIALEMLTAPVVPSNPHSYLGVHCVQTRALNRQLILQSNLSDEEKQRQLYFAELYAITHDVGRRYDMNGIHGYLGGIVLEAAGFPRRIHRMGPAHHLWGQGGHMVQNEVEGKNITAEVARCIDRKGEVRDLKTLLRTISAIDKLWELAGIAMIISDVSKDYPDGSNCGISEIAVLTDEIGRRQIKRQIEVVRRFAEGSPEHLDEIRGLAFIRQIISYVENKYEINYSSVVQEAKKVWRNIQAEVQYLWETTPRPQYPNPVPAIRN